MKNTKPIYWICLFVSFIIVITFNLSWAKDCSHVFVNAVTTASNPFGPYSGNATVEINQVSYQADVFAELVNMSGPTEDGTFHMETVTEFYFPALLSYLYAFESVVLSPTSDEGIYRMNSRMDVTGGTGYFAESFGKLSSHGFVSFVTFEIEVSAKGKICF